MDSCLHVLKNPDEISTGNTMGFKTVLLVMKYVTIFWEVIFLTIIVEAKIDTYFNNLESIDAFGEYNINGTHFLFLGRYSCSCF